MKISSQKEIKAYYEQGKIAKEYKEKRFSSGWANFYHKRQVQIINKFLKSKKFTSILEIAPGPARLTKELETLKIKNKICLENSPEMIKIASKTLKDTPWEVVQGDAFNFDLGRKFELIYTFRFIRHFKLKDRKKLYKEIERNLEKEGFLIFEVPNFYIENILRLVKGSQNFPIYDKLWRKKEIKKELEEAGFNVVLMEPILKWFFLQGVFSKLKWNKGIEYLEKIYTVQPLEWIIICQKK